jgi:hypothetical protein
VAVLGRSRWFVFALATPFAAAAPLALAAISLALGSCTSSGDTADAAYLGVQGEASAPLGVCGAVEQEQPIEGWTHEAVCSYIEYFTSPPSSGNHYPIWAAYKTYTTPVPDGFFVHNLEHGAVVLTYNCALYDGADDGGACDADIAAAQAMLDAIPTDPDCVAQGSPVLHRTLMTPDPNLDVPFAASSWGWTLRARCFDPVVFGAFATAHADRGREDICADGDDVSYGLQPGCGDPP